METEEAGNTSSISAPMKTTTTWRVIHGALDKTVVVESSLSPENPDSAAVGISRKHPLVLRRAAPTDGPCEITISFTQLHEIRQIYVRSTARVYEVYYAANSKIENEYLCTVRCGMAAKVEMPEVTKDYEVLQAADVDGSVNLSPNTKCLIEVESRNSEDGWVEVKVPSSPWMQNGGSFDPNQNCLERGSQDFYEATAEISDADTCISLTLRLLSIQKSESVCIDEIYVFAEPAVSSDMDCPPDKMENSAGSALMSMFIPTLLRLSNSQISNIVDDKYSDAPETRLQDADTKLLIPDVSPGDILQQRVPCVTGAQKVVLEDEISFPGDPMEVLTSKESHDNDENHGCITEDRSVLSNHIEKTLDRLVSQVSKIEDFCLRLEKNMLKPLIGIEARLQRLEEQLDCLMKDSRSSVSASGTRIFAPEFSCDGSESSSFYADGNSCSSCRPLELFKVQDSHEEELSTEHNELPISSGASQLLPSLVVTAPEFSYVEDDKEKDPVDVLRDPDPPKHNFSKPLSIDDALASALDGFLSSTSIRPSESAILSTSIRPESACFLETDTILSSIDDSGGRGEKVTSSIIKVNEPAVPSMHQNVSNLTASMKSLVLISNKDHDENADDGDSHLGGKFFGSTMESEPEQVDKQSRDDHSIGEEVVGREAANMINGGFTDDTEDPFVLHGSLSSVTSIAASDPAVDVGACTADKEVMGEVTDSLQTVIKLPSASVVDFTIPVLDVHFLSQEDRASLEDFLGKIHDSDVNVASVTESDGELNGVPSLLVDIEDQEVVTSSFDFDHQLMDFNYCSSFDLPSDISREEHQYSHVCGGQDAVTGLI